MTNTSDINKPNDKYWQNRRCGQPDKKGCLSRTPWDHDYGRVVHSASFRRLQVKTQIFGVGENDFYRTRLTHSLETSQIGEGIRNKLCRKLRCNEIDNKKYRIRWLPDSFLIRTVCLAHDLGHPPFGHGDEVALNRCMLDHGGFESNGQALRIVTRLEKYTDNYGLNLTRRAVLGLIKYPAPYRSVNNSNFYPSTSTYLLDKPVFNSAEFKPPKCYLNEEHLQIVKGWLGVNLVLRQILL